MSPALKDLYMMQITTTIISPTPLIAVNFYMLTRIVQQLGSCYSWISPKWYSIIFIFCDNVALIQGMGGGMASSATDLHGANIGANVMLGGIVFQFVGCQIVPNPTT
ncbi:hypothetical protein B0H10DRAFT_2212514 [Mycena sp. CBHHK59/15]|nr:hypothetical protein B0H10DRAFT_2212514 [Mycena sp. CBHHK59/15]